VAREMGLLARTERLDLSGLTAPIHVWHGADDPVGSAEDFVAWMGQPCAEIRAFPGTGHFLPHKLWPEVMAWLAADKEVQAMADSVSAN